MERQLELAQMVDAILADFEKHGYPLPPQAQKRVDELENWIDAKVSALSKTEGRIGPGRLTKKETIQHLATSAYAVKFTPTAVKNTATV